MSSAGGIALGVGLGGGGDGSNGLRRAWWWSWIGNVGGNAETRDASLRLGGIMGPCLSPSTVSSGS